MLNPFGFFKQKSVIRIISLLVYVNNKKGVKKIRKLLKIPTLLVTQIFFARGKKPCFCRLFFRSSKSLHDMYLEVLSGRRGAKTSPIK